MIAIKNVLTCQDKDSCVWELDWSILDESPGVFGVRISSLRGGVPQGFVDRRAQCARPFALCSDLGTSKQSMWVTPHIDVFDEAGMFA